MKILVFGAGGQLGTEWRGFLEKKEPSVNWKAYRSSELDITDSDKLKEVVEGENPDLVINCAAYTRVDDAEDDPDRAESINARAVGEIAELCFSIGARLVHYSTDYVFPGDREDRLSIPNGYREDHPARPINIYGKTKWEGEKAIRETGCKHLIIRVSWLCGQYGNNFVKTMLRLADEKTALDIVDDQWGSPSFTDNVVENSYCLIEQEAEGTYHLSSNGLISWADFAESVFAISGKEVEVNRVDSGAFPVKARRPCFSKLDTAKVAQIPCVSLENWKLGLQRLVDKL